MTYLAAIQSSYIPWKGYFDIINDVDLFVFYDDVQFTPRDWRSRNQIKGPNGLHWLSVPVGAKRSRLICEVDILDSAWQEKHYQTFVNFYSNCAHFSDYSWILDEIYRTRNWRSLSELNQFSTKLIAKVLGINTVFLDSRQFNLTGSKQDRMMDLIKKTEATSYLSGPSASSYLTFELFDANQVDLTFKDYDSYPAYTQKYGAFAHSVSILDLIFNVGSESPSYIWGWRDSRSSD